MDLNQPCFQEKDGKYYLYKSDFTPAEEGDGFSSYISVSGGLPAYFGPYDSEEKLQKESVRMFGEKATIIS